MATFKFQICDKTFQTGRRQRGGPKSLRVGKSFREQVQAPSIRGLGNLVVRVRALATIATR